MSQPFSFTYRSRLSNINPELIKSKMWMIKDNGVYYIHSRERGKKIGDIIYFGSKLSMYENAEFIVNKLLKKKNLI